MSPLKITVIHQWWLETEALAQLLFSGNATHIETRFYPHVTDCSETIFSLPAADERLFSARLRAYFSLPDYIGSMRENVRIEIEGTGIDERILQIWFEFE